MTTKINKSLLWLIIKILFNKVKFKKILDRHTTAEIEDYKEKAIKEENYELAAYLKYYIQFKKEETNQKINNIISK